MWQHVSIRFGMGKNNNLHQVWSVAMDYGTKRQSVSKGRWHVLYFHIVVMFTLKSTPLLESPQRSHYSADLDFHVFIIQKSLSLSPQKWGKAVQPGVFLSARTVKCHRRGLDEGAAAAAVRQHPTFHSVTFIYRQWVTVNNEYYLLTFC